jgi:uncharacterized glyoxalase superfamily protein PhnB
MTDAAPATEGRSSPGLRYRDVGAAVDWLSKAFGFQVRSLEKDVAGNAAYAELAFGSTIIMVGAASGNGLDRYMKQPGDIGGAETQCSYYVAADVDALYVRARRAGAEIVIDLETRTNGARNFTCRDPEGHLWCFGTYDPYLADASPRLRFAGTRPVRPLHPLRTGPLVAPKTAKPAARPPMDMKALTDAGARVRASVSAARFPLPARLAAGLSVAAIVSGTVAAWIYADAWQTSRKAEAGPAAMIGPERMIGAQLGGEMFQQAIKDARRRLAAERRSRRAAERALHIAREEADRERSLRLTAEETAKRLAAELDEAHRAAEQARRAARTAQDKLTEQDTAAATPDEQEGLRQELASAQQAARAARDKLADAQKAASAAATQRATAEQSRLQAEQAKAEAERLRSDAESRLAAAERAKQIAEDARAAAQREASETRARLTFVSLSAKESSADAIVRLREQMESEKSAREAAEQEAEGVRDQLARERRLKADAWHTVTVLRRRLASLGGARAPRHKASAQRASTPKASGEWSLYSGPHFVKSD